MTIISKRTAKRLIAAGQVNEIIVLKPDEYGKVYVGISRVDIQRIDHYLDRTDR